MPVPSFTAAAAVVAATDLVATLPASLVASHDQRLRRLEGAAPTQTVELAMSWHERTDRDPANVAFRALVREIITDTRREEHDAARWPTLERRFPAVHAHLQEPSAERRPLVTPEGARRVVDARAHSRRMGMFARRRISTSGRTRFRAGKQLWKKSSAARRSIGETASPQPRYARRMASAEGMGS